MKIQLSRYNYVLLSGLLLLCSSWAPAAHAATVTFMPDSTSPQGVLSVRVLLNPDNDSINALSGSLAYDPSVLTFDHIDVKNSPVNVWVELPREIYSGKISWSGIIPGGFSGVRSPLYEGSRPGLLATLYFRPNATATTTLTPFELEAHANDGSGTALAITAAPVSVVVVKPSNSSEAALDKVLQPIILEPNSTWATINRSPLVDSRAWYMAAYPADQTVSIDHIDIAESAKSNIEAVSEEEWKPTSGPYILQDQSRRSYVHVRFVTALGQQYLLTLAPMPEVVDKNYTFWYILIAVVAFIVFLFKRNLFIARHD